MRNLLLQYCLFLLFACSIPTAQENKEVSPSINSITDYSLIVLGTIQDGGSPHMGCKKDCCKDLFENPDVSRQVVSLGLIDNKNNKRYLFEATPDLTRQVKRLMHFGGKKMAEVPDGIFLTHAHIGHYAGLMFLGKEAMNANKVPVYAMPRMVNYLESNGPWGQLVTNGNIFLQKLSPNESFALSGELLVTPFLVPHRDEYSETVGYKISGPNKSALFIPDIDKWEKWEKDIIAEIKKVDYAFLDATFFSGKEINNRDISLIPHPFIIESLKKFGDLPEEEKNKIIFIHFNHTNPVIDLNSSETEEVLNNGFGVARIGEVFEL